MDPDIRPQDDLFGHVNGRWLDSATIPDDRSSWGPFVMLADQAEEHVREIIEACAQGRIEGEEARKIGDLYASFMDEERVDELGYSPIVPLLEQVDAITDLPSLAHFLGLVRAPRRGRPVRLLRRHRRPRLRPLPRPARPGRHRPARRELLPRGQARRGPRQVRRLPPPAADPRRAARPRGHRRPRARPGDPHRRGSLGARSDSRRHQDLQPALARRARVHPPQLRLHRVDHRAGRRPRHRRRDGRAPALLLRAPRGGPRGDLDRGLEGVPDRARHPHRGGVPLGRLRRDQLRLLRPHPVGHPRAARPLEARRRAGAGRAWARRSARSTSPATSRRAPRS